MLISLRWVKEFALHNPIIMVILVSAVGIAVLYWFFGTELGCGIRATGSNPAMSRAQGINTNFNIVLGLAVSNALVALSGALPVACAQGLIWCIMAIGVYLTYRILDVADLTVDGSFGTGGAVCVMCLLSGQNVWVSLLDVYKRQEVIPYQPSMAS